MKHIIPRIDRERFEVLVLCAESGLDLCRRAIPAGHVQWASFPHDLEQSVAAMAATRCDILYHRQIGTAVTNYFLPFARCAPIQCTGWGSHGTTGMREVDYYLSSDLIEIDGAEQHYTERLFRFHHALPTCQSRVRPPEPATREDFGLPGRGALYFCPQRIEKIHPAFDGLLRGILDSDPDGTIVMLQGRHPGAFEQLTARFRRTLGPRLLKRIAFAPSLPGKQYYRLFALADLVLDAPNYSTSLTGFDAFSLGVPIVTLPGARNVERYALALYRKLGITDLIVESEQQYVQMAVQVGTDGDFRQHLRESILKRSDLIFEDHEAVKEHERFFEYAWQHREELTPP